MSILGSSLKTNLVKALEMASTQRKVADEFSETFPEGVIRQWRKMVKEWEENPSQPNPYSSNERGTCFEDI